MEGILPASLDTSSATLRILSHLKVLCLSFTSLMFVVRMFASLCMHEPRPEAPIAPAAAPPERDECQRMLAMLPAAAQPKKALKPTQKSYTLRRPGRSSIGILLQQKSFYVTKVQTIPRDEHGTPLISQKKEQ